MTDKIYYQDQYLKELQAKVTTVDGNKIVLDKTIFIPQTNAEPGDFGKINRMKISGSKKDEENIWHIFPKEINFKVGDEVTLELDWNKRIYAMKSHSALHLLAGVFDSVYGFRPVAGSIKSNQSNLVFSKEIDEKIIIKAIGQANKDIKINLDIKSFWDGKRAGFRWVQVGNYPPIPCGGLHVKNANEIVEIKYIESVKESNKFKIIISIG